VLSVFALALSLGLIAILWASLAGGASCTASVNVIATTAGPHTNVSGFVSSTEGGTNTTATGSAVATLTALQPPSITKTFSTSPILAGATALLTVTIQNPNSGNALSGVAVSDTYPPGLVNANPLMPAVTNTCGGAVTVTVTAAAAASMGIPSRPPTANSVTEPAAREPVELNNPSIVDNPARVSSRRPGFIAT
jgi:hypothetical protein